MVILDNGHGENTHGKRSPEGMLTEDGMTALYEFEFNRDIVDRLIKMCDQNGIDFYELVPESEDISLTERCERVNKIFAKNPKAYLVSIHANAGGGTGWEVFTSPGETRSDKIAEVFFKEAEKELVEFRMRSDNSDNDHDKEARFTMLTKTNCPAILTENLFMDHEKDLAFLISDEGRQRIAELHFRAIERIEKLESI